MANLKSDGKVFDANLIIQSGITMTAGSMVWVDVSGTNVVHLVRSYSGVSLESAAIPGTGLGVASLDAHGSSGIFLGVLAKTQTGIANLSGGNQTGVTWYPRGVFEFNTTPTASCLITVGRPVWAINHDTVLSLASGLSADPTAKNVTGTTPIGYVSFIPGAGLINTNSAARTVRVMVEAGVHIVSKLY